MVLASASSPRAAARRDAAPAPPRGGARGEKGGGAAVQTGLVIGARLGEIELEVDLARRRRGRGQLVQQPPAELARLDRVLLARLAVHHLDPHARLPDAVAQLRGEVPLDLLAAELADAGQQRADVELRAARRHERALVTGDGVARVAAAHAHLVQAPVRARGAHGELIAHRPEAQDPDAELALEPLRAFGLHAPFDRVADEI